MGGDYEFIIMDASDNQITLLGKKYGNTMTMTRMPVTTKWKEYIRGVNEIEENAYLYQFDIMAGGEKIGYLKRDNYTLSFSGKQRPLPQRSPLSLLPTDFTSANLLLSMAKNAIFCLGQCVHDIHLYG